MSAKKVLRIKMLEAREQHTNEELAQMSELVVSHLWHMPEVATASLLMGYLSFGREISLDAFIKRAQLIGKRICVPRICDRRSAIIRPNLLADIQAVHTAELGIRTPQVECYVQPEAIDVVLVPGVAFSETGQRLGMGRGYYDRFLLTTKAVRIGICAGYNLLDTVPVDEHDVCMDYLVSPAGIIKVTGSR